MGVQIAPCEWTIFRGKDMPGHAPRHCAMSCAKNGRTDRDAVWVVDSDGPKEACVTSYMGCTLALAGKYD